MSANIKSNSNIIKSVALFADVYRDFVSTSGHEPETIYVEYSSGLCEYFDLMGDGLSIDAALEKFAEQLNELRSVDMVMCIEDDERVCEDCGEVMSESDAVRYEGSYYCEDCAIDSEDLTQCEECGEWVAECDLVEVRDYRHVGYCSDYTSVYVCEDCANSIAVKCDECGCWYMGVGDEDNQVEVRTADGGSEWRNLCGGCLEDNYTVCDVCNEYVHVDNAVYTDYGTYCPDCVSHVDLQDYDHTYKHMELRTGDENDGIASLLLGVELETESDDNEATAVAVRDAVEAVTGRRDAVSCKSDGSLAGGGCEIVTQPFSPSYHLTTDFWRDVVSAARENGATSHDNGHCGLHVHISRDYLADYGAVCRLSYLLGAHADKWRAFSRRKCFTYCRLDAASTLLNNPQDMTPYQRIATYHSVSDHMGHYAAINEENEATVEVRIMRGTLKLSTIYAALEAVTALAIIAHDYSDEAVDAMGWDELKYCMYSKLEAYGLRSDELQDYIKARRL